MENKTCNNYNNKIIKELALKNTKKLKEDYFKFYDDIKIPTHKKIDW